jgi:hypothetical protein
MTNFKFSHIPFDGNLTDDKIVCQNCGWSWKVKDGGDDLYVCHKCYTDNSNFYLSNSNFEGADSSEEITKVKSSVNNKKRNTNYVIIGLIAVILGYYIYKKIKK